MVFVLVVTFSTSISASDTISFSANDSAITGNDTISNYAEEKQSELLLLSVDDIAISTAEDLISFRNRVNSGENHLNAYLTGDINLNEVDWTPIGTSEAPFSGRFNGNGYSVVGLNVDEVVAGLFGETKGAYITSLIVDGYVYGGSVGGGIVGLATDTYIIDCGNFAVVYGGSSAGGIVGWIRGSCDLTIEEPIASNTSVVSKCYNAAAIFGSFAVGGIAGMSDGYTTIMSCYNLGDMNCPDGPSGGICGLLGGDGFVASSYNVGSCDNSEAYGEIIGFIKGNGGVANCYYVDLGYKGIYIDEGSYVDQIYYAKGYDDFRKSNFVSRLNDKSNSDFIYDEFNINDSFPIFEWELLRVNRPSPLPEPEPEPEPVPVPDPVVPVFIDVPAGSWYYDYVYDLVGCGIINGMTAITYEPDGNITRAQFAKILAVASGENTSGYDGKVIFADCKGHWADEYINWAYNRGIVKGISATAFAPDNNITRQEMATMIMRYAKYIGFELPWNNAVVTFKDDAQIADWAVDAVYSMQKAGIINGRPGNVFDPLGNATRAEAAKMFSIFLHLR